MTGAGIARLIRRRAVNDLRIRWRRDPWAHGVTIVFAPDIAREFSADVSDAGIAPDALAPSVLDWLAWKWRLFVLDRDRPQQWAAVLAELPRRRATAGPPPCGWMGDTPASVSAATVYVVPAAPGPFSKRRRLDTRLTRTSATTERERWTARAGTLADNEAPLSGSDSARAAAIFVEYSETLRPALVAIRPDEDARLRLALAYGRLLKDGDHEAWVAALDLLRAA